MFYLVTLKKNLDIHPKHFGKHLREFVQQQLVDKVGSLHLLACSMQPFCSPPYRIVLLLPEPPGGGDVQRAIWLRGGRE